jgi:hypothetical protein
MAAVVTCLVVLRHAQRIVIARRQVWLKVLLDVVRFAERMQLINHPQRVITPIGCLRDRHSRQGRSCKDRQPVSCINDRQQRLDINYRFKANPREDAAVVDRSQRGDASARRRWTMPKAVHAAVCALDLAC